MVDYARLREVSWQEIFPWLRIVSALRLALTPSLLALGAIGWVATIAGWRIIAWPFDSQPVAWPWQTTRISDRPLIPTNAAEISQSPFIHAWETLNGYGRAMFDWNVGWQDFTMYLLFVIWALLVWSLFGAAITRIAAVSLARGDRLGFRAGLAHGIRRWPLYLFAVAIPLAGVLIIAFFLMIGGALTHPNLVGFADFMLVVGGILWPLALLAGFIMALLLIGLAVGWPLMWPTISVESTDAFDALSRSYSYAFHRPIRYLFYVIVAAVLGLLGWYVVDLFVRWIVDLSYWGLSWGAGVERTREIREAALAATATTGSATTTGEAAREWNMFRIGAGLIGFWQTCLRILALGFVYSFFWSAATAIYYLLRRDEDGTELSDVTYDETGEPRGLPPLSSDALGVPAVSDVRPTPATSTTEPPAGGG